MTHNTTEHTRTLSISVPAAFFTRFHRAGLLLLLSAALVFTGCTTTSMPTPNLYVYTDAPIFTDLNPDLKRDFVEILYVTDRKPNDSGSVEAYGSERSMSLAYGRAIVRFGTDLDWNELERLSKSESGSHRREPTVAETLELDRLPDTRETLTVLNGRLALKPEVQAIAAEMLERFHQALRVHLAATPSKFVNVYVHGYNVPFNQAIGDMAQLHHFLGREGVPVAYTWPAGHGGLLRGYSVDRESSEFTIFHFKQFLRAVASSPEVTGINIIAHSRGTDVVLTALRELHLSLEGQGQNTAETLKLHHVVLAAPDIDFEVFQQRFGAERVFNSMNQFTLYLSASDRALGLATFLFDSVRRLGRLEITDLTQVQRENLSKIPNASVIDVRTKRNDFLGHGYFLMDPAVNSDLILLLRYDARPGKQNGRPLVRGGDGFWLLNDREYPRLDN